MPHQNMKLEQESCGANTIANYLKITNLVKEEKIDFGIALN